MPANDKPLAEAKIEEKALPSILNVEKPIASKPEMVMKKLPLFDAVIQKEELNQAPSGAPAKGAFINPMGFFRAQKNEEKKAIDSKPNFVVEVLDAKRE